jgi:hypothetical protein
MAMFASLAFGAPVGTTLYALGGFTAVAVATMVVPLIAVLLVAPLSPVPAPKGTRAGPGESARHRLAARLWRSIEHCRVWRDDCLQALLSAQHGWNPVWLTFSAFAIAWSRPGCFSVMSLTRWAERRSRWFACLSKQPASR